MEARGGGLMLEGHVAGIDLIGWIKVNAEMLMLVSDPVCLTVEDKPGGSYTHNPNPNPNPNLTLTLKPQSP